MTQSKTLKDVLYIRCFAVISLVVWHSYCIYICQGYADSPMHDAYARLFSFLTPDANMPLFTFLAGYLFCYLLKTKHKYPDFRGFLKNKVHRLLVPFLVLGTLTNLTMIGRPLMDFYYGKPSHLWYCLMLFYCYVICWLVEKFGGKKWNLILCGLSCGVVLWRCMIPLGVNSPLGLFLPMYYYCYFYIGFWVFEYKEYVMKWIGKYWLILVAVNFYLAWFVKPRLFLFHCLSYILILLYLANKLELRASTTTPPRFGYSQILNSISKCSMGIYIIHAWIIWNVTNIESFHGFINEHFLIFPFICWIFVFLFSWGATHVLIKYTRIGRYFLL